MRKTRKRPAHSHWSNFTDFLSVEAIDAGASLTYSNGWYSINFRSRTLSVSNETEPSVRQLRNLADTIVYIKRPLLYDPAYIVSIADDIPDRVREKKTTK